MSEQEPEKRERQRTPNHRTTTGFRICDERWAVLQALLPVHIIHSFRSGWLRVADGDCADAIFYVLRTGCPLNRFRRLLVGWEKKPENYLAFLHFACGLIAFRAAGLFR